MISIVTNNYHLHGFAYSNIGGRPENQDSFAVQETPLGVLVVVCDGMGGGPGGKTASRIARTEIVNTVMAYANGASRQEALKVAIGRAHEAIVKEMARIPQLQGMGSTAIAIIINNQSAVIACLGDSRCYRIKKGKVAFKTIDHSLVAELVKRKVITEEQARTSPQSNVITRALGTTSNQVPDIFEVAYKKGDRFVLCTDGFWGSMPEPQLVSMLASQSDMASLVNNVASTVDCLGMECGGGHDNHTMAIIEMDDNSILKEGMDKSTKILFAVLCGLLTISVIMNVVLLMKPRGNEYLTVIDNQNRTIEDLGKYKIRYEEIVSNGNKDLVEVVEEYRIQADSMQEIISDLRLEIDSLKAVIPQPQAKEKKTEEVKQNKETSSVNSDLEKALVAMKNLKDYKNSNMNTTLKEKEKFRKQALELFKQLKGKYGNLSSATINSICDKLNDKVIVEIMLDRDNKYISTKRAKETIDKVIERAKTLK